MEFTATKFEEGCFWKTKRINGSSFEHRDIALRGNEQVWPNELATVVDVASRDAGESQSGSDPRRGIVIGGPPALTAAGLLQAVSNANDANARR